MSEIKGLSVAFVGVSHWHVPLYLPVVGMEGLTVAGVSDDDASKAADVAARLGCRAYASASELLDREKPDFVFAFAIHSRMPDLALDLIERGIPFTMEKPLGLTADDVRRVGDAAAAKGIFCAIPLVWRYSDLVAEFRRDVAASHVRHLAFRFIAGPSSRYVGPSPWMLSAAKAGGGCMTNLGVHFIDLALLLTGSESARVLGSSFHGAAGYDIEDYASTLIELSSGASAAIETGYAYPMDEQSKRDNRWTIVTNGGYHTLGDGFFERRDAGPVVRRVEMVTDSDPYYAVFAAKTLREFVGGIAPTCGLGDLLRTRIVLDDINRMARRG